MRFFGGDFQFSGDDIRLKLDKLKQSIPTSPCIIKDEYDFIYNLVKNNSQRDSLQKAAENYMVKDYLENGLGVLVYDTPGAKVQNLNLNDSIVVSLKNELHELMNIKFLDHDQVEKLDQKIKFQVIPPEWWNEVRICFRYYADDPSGSHQCGPDSGCEMKTLCARLNRLTEAYTDTTQTDAKGACVMSWSVKGPLFIDKQHRWFENTRLCFRYKSQDGYYNGQSGGSNDDGKGESCAAVNSYTKNTKMIRITE